MASRPIMLLLFLLFVVLFSFPILKIHQDEKGEGWTPKNSKKLEYKAQFVKDFGNDEVILLYLSFPPSQNSESHLSTLEALHDSITKKIYGFQNVFSRYTFSQLEEVMGSLYAKKMERLYFKNIDTTGEMIFLQVRDNKDMVKNRPLLIDSLQQLIKKTCSPDIKIHLSGQSLIFNEINRLSSSDSAKLFFFCFLFIFILLWWQVKRFSYLLLSLSLILIALIPAISLFGWLDIPFNMITMMAPLLFVVNFSSFAIHIITKQSTDIGAYLLKKAPPIICSALATIIGFGSLYTSKIELISQFGLLTSLGIIVGLFVQLLIGVPMAIRLIKINELVANDSHLNKFLDSFYSKLSIKVALGLLWLLIIVMAGGIYVFPKIKTDTNAIQLMKQNNEVRKTVTFIEQHFGSGNAIDFLVVKTNKEPINANDLALMAIVRKEVNTLPFVQSSITYDLWRPFFDKLAVSDKVMADKLKSNFVTPDLCQTRMVVNIPTGSVKEMDTMLNQIIEKINQALKKHGNESMIIAPAGFLPAYIEQMNTIVDGMLYGLIIAVILILIVMLFLVRDWKLGFITIIITIFPLCAVAILMKVLNIPFDVGTSIISSVAIGMIADDALHIIWNLKATTRSSKTDSTANVFANAVRQIVYPCTVTSVMFSIGFAVLLYSNMVSIIEFGFLSTATIILAWISDFFLFPALLLLFYKSKA